MKHPDPLCPVPLHDLDYCDVCSRLRMARVAGPIPHNHIRNPDHAPFCWCDVCMGTAVGPT